MMRNRIFAFTAVCSIAAICGIGNMNRAGAASTTQSAATTTAATPAITWDEAAKHVDETVTVTGPVVGTHVTSTKALVLNIGKDYPDPARFSVMITPKDKEELSEDSYKGKTVTVTGKIVLYKKVPEIKAKSADVTIEP
jgi:DNA/RNA endonuclease YhcR with UshA esterase domain